MFSRDIVFEGREVRGVLERGPTAARKLIVLLDYWRPDRKGFDEITRSSCFTHFGCDTLYVQVSRNHWYLTDELEVLAPVVEDIARHYESARTFGFSMGGFGALVLANLASLAAAVSVSPRLPPLGHYLDTRIPERNHSTRCTFLFDPNVEKDAIAVEILKSISSAPSIIELPCGGHPATSVLRRAGLAGKVFAQLISDHPSVDSITKLHGQACQTKSAAVARSELAKSEPAPSMSFRARRRRAKLARGVQLAA